MPKQAKRLYGLNPRGKSQVWYFDFWFLKKRRAGSTGIAGLENYDEAVEFVENERKKWRRAEKLGHATTHWEDAVKTYLRYLDNRKSIETTMIRLDWLSLHLNGKTLEEITPTVIEDITNKSMKTKIVRGGNVSDDCRAHSTTNKYLRFITTVLKDAQSRGKLLDLPPVPLLPEGKKEAEKGFDEQSYVRVEHIVLQPEDEAKLIEALSGSRRRHIHDMVVFSIETGLRQTNVCELRWRQIDLDAGTVTIEGELMKNGKPFPAIPLSDRALNVLRERLELAKKAGRIGGRVFTQSNGKPVNDPNNSRGCFKAAAREIELPELTWHSLRHTFATRCVEAGVPLEAIQLLGAWRDLDTLMKRYWKPNTDYLRKFVNRPAPVEAPDNVVAIS